MKNNQQLNGNYSYLDNSNPDANSNMKNSDNPSTAEELQTADPMDGTETEEESAEAELYASSQNGAETDIDVGESSESPGKVDKTINQTEMINENTSKPVEDKEPESSDDTVAEIIIKSDNILSNQEKEQLLKEIESEIDSLFDEIDNISDDKEIEEQIDE